MKRRSFIHSFEYAWQGVVYCFQTQPNMRIHFAAAILAWFFGWRLGLSAGEMALLLLTIGVVFVAEMINTAVEKLVDLACPNYHPLAKIAKDAAAGAVLAAAVFALGVGYYLLLSRL